MHLLIEQVLVLTKDIFWRNIVRKYDLIVALVEHYPVAVCFGCVYFQNDRIAVPAFANLHSSIDINRQMNILPFHRFQAVFQNDLRRLVRSAVIKYRRRNDRLFRDMHWYRVTVQCTHPVALYLEPSLVRICDYVR